MKVAILKTKLLNKKTKFLLYGLFSAVAFILSFYFLFSNFSPQLIDSDAKQGWDKNDMTDVEMFDFQTDYFKGDTKVWEIESRQARIYNQKDLTKMENIKLRYFKNGAVDGEVKADKANIRNSTRDVFMEGNVHMMNSKGTVARSEEFHYNSRTGAINSSKKVTITRPNGFVISGTGFSAGANLENIMFYSNVSGEVDEETANLDGSLNSDF